MNSALNAWRQTGPGVLRLPRRKGPTYAPRIFTDTIIRTHPMPASLQHAASYYAASSLPQPDYPALAGDLTADVCAVSYTHLTLPTIYSV